MHLISGAGGKSHRARDNGDPRLTCSNTSDDGARCLALSPGHANLSFVTAEGRTLDATWVACRTR